eukprot:scaffold40805_cov45-Phaeocystis_antarctica.AAC.3
MVPTLQPCRGDTWPTTLWRLMLARGTTLAKGESGDPREGNRSCASFWASRQSENTGKKKWHQPTGSDPTFLLCGGVA